ncbi:hypothetical protein Poli38472_005944 [Pythium oligandrum]|uniref:Uncharacterized protein n=1 Tax=Pythium oligandrum TaxID=41045 RepID=A0A8K1FMP8_PYTOL|nr:hypothetical protein Poli38472_005944 [Pythium oligandrum]|eukprot:TMW68476.1 hypothetical protein Poli38472_005944 [Pythium oligandrum]
MPSVLYAYGANAYSLGMRSVYETKDNFLLVCIGFLEALDRLQVKLHLPTALVRELRRKLVKMVDRSLARPVTAPTHHALQKAESLGELITESDAWGDVTKPSEVKGFVNWLLAVMKSLNDLAYAGTVGVCRGIFILILNFPGVPTTCSLFCRIFEMVESALHLGGKGTQAATAQPRGSKRASGRENYMGDPSLTAVVLEYREKKCMVPMNINKRIQRVMHFQIPLRSFEATVRLPPDGDATHHEVQEHLQPYPKREGSFSSISNHSSASPRSIPVSPLARKKYQRAYASFSDDVLYQARDRLRLERAATLTGERDLQIPRFSAEDCNQEIFLTCARHCATKEGPGMYRSVRATIPVVRNRYAYFEMAFNQVKSPRSMNDVRSSGKIAQPDDTELSACVGLSTRSMGLNTLVGTARFSVGFFSAGYVLVGNQRRRFQSMKFGYNCSSTVGVLVRIRESADYAPGIAKAEVRFSVNGVALRDSANQVLVTEVAFPSRTELFPTVSLHTQHIRVYGRFSAPDIADLNVAEFELPDESPEICCLDGLMLNTTIPSGQATS